MHKCAVWEQGRQGGEVVAAHPCRAAMREMMARTKENPVYLVTVLSVVRNYSVFGLFRRSRGLLHPIEKI